MWHDWGILNSSHWGQEVTSLRYEHTGKRDPSLTIALVIKVINSALLTVIYLDFSLSLCDFRLFELVGSTFLPELLSHWFQSRSLVTNSLPMMGVAPVIYIFLYVHSLSANVYNMDVWTMLQFWSFGDPNLFQTFWNFWKLRHRPRFNYWIEDIPNKSSYVQLHNYCWRENTVLFL